MTLPVPTMVYLLLDYPALARTDLSALELLLYGASPMSPARLEQGLQRIGPVFSQLYGQTECYPISVKTAKGAAHAPKRVEFVDALPMMPVGKVDKQALRVKYRAGQARQVG